MRLLFLSLLALAACSPETVDEETAPADTSSPSLPDEAQSSSEGDAAPSENQSGDRQFASTMPAELRGDWHKDDLGRAPTAQDCDPRLRGTIDWDRLMSVDEGGYSYFETGGRIMEVHNRTPTMIDATFDTTYADEPTSERRDFALQSNGTLAVNLDDGDGVMEVVQYRRCPS